MITHPELVKVLAKPGEDILKELTPADCNLWHMASCCASEAGELFDAVKKHVIYRKPLDRENIIEEMGDLEFYLEGARQELKISREEVLTANIHKLSVRYQNLKFSNEQAQYRADKQPGRVLTDEEAAVHKEIIHHLSAGRAPCGVIGVPREWPQGHLWSADWTKVTCPKCLTHKPGNLPVGG